MPRISDGQGNELKLNTDGSAKVSIIGSLTKVGQTNVATAGTRVALGTTQPLIAITIVAKSTNTKNIYVGDNTVNSTNGFILPPGAGHSWSGSGLNVANFFLDSDVNGEGVSWTGVSV
jgi:hypothetical protein